MEPVVTARRDGFTLVEVLVALAILAVGLLGLAAVQIEALSQGSKGRHTTDAASVGRTHLEQVMRVPWTVLDTAQAAGTWVAPAWAGAAPTSQVSVDMPGGGATVVEHTYNVTWRVSDVTAGDSCLRDIEVRVSWSDEGYSSARALDLATRRFNWEDPDC